MYYLVREPKEQSTNFLHHHHCLTGFFILCFSLCAYIYIYITLTRSETPDEEMKKIKINYFTKSPLYFFASQVVPLRPSYAATTACIIYYYY